MSAVMSTIGEICEFSRGLTYKKSDEVDVSNNRVLRANNITLETGEINFNEIKYISDEIDIPFPKKVKKGSLLICTASGSKKHLGKIAFIEDDIDFAFGGFMGMLTPKEGLHPKYLYWITQSHKYKEFILGLNDGANINNLKFSQLAQFEVPLFSINEQKRIVAILDQAFAEIERARANAQQNLNNARELFESYLQQVFSQRGDGWEDKKWGDLCDFIRGPFGGSLKKSMFVDEGYVVYEQKHAIHDHFNQLRYFIDQEKFNEMKRFEVKPGDIIMSCSGVTLGRVAVIPKGIRKGIINQALLKLTPKKGVSVHFIKHWLRSKTFQDIIFEYAGGAAIPNVPSAKIMKEIVISLPAIKEQEVVVNNIELFLSDYNKLALIYQQKIDKLDELKKSILQKAFSGQLLRNNTVSSTVIPFPQSIPNINTTDLHAGIIAIAYLHHEDVGKEKQFGHVKAEKIAHMVEALLGIDLDRNPIQDAAGPNDYPHFKKKVEPRAKKAGFFEFIGNETSGYRLIKKGQFNKIVEKTRAALEGRNTEVDNLIHSMVKMSTKSSEIFATVYAAWNNLLLKKVAATDELIVLTAREEWHESKLDLSRDRFFKAIKWIRENDMEPKGQGKHVK